MPKYKDMPLSEIPHGILKECQKLAKELLKQGKSKAEVMREVDARGDEMLQEAQLAAMKAAGLSPQKIAAEQLRRACSSEELLPIAQDNTASPQRKLSALDRACGATDSPVENDRAPKNWTRKRIDSENLLRACSGKPPLIEDDDDSED